MLLLCRLKHYANDTESAALWGPNVLYFASITFKSNNMNGGTSLCRNIQNRKAAIIKKNIPEVLNYKCSNNQCFELHALLVYGV